MTCTYCGTELPTGALFCGECGRAVVFAAEAPGRPARDRLATSAANRSAPAVEDRNRGTAPREAVPADAVRTPAAIPSLVEPGPHGVGLVTCAQCGATMADDDIFCGECGFVSRAASEDFGRSRDTAIIELAPRAPAATRPPPPRVVDHLPDFESLSASPVVPARPESVILPAPVAPEQVAPSRRPDGPSSAAPFDDAADLEATRISRAGRAGERFVLQFSTGESFTVYGTGLIGRNPRSEPGEYFDQLVRALDPSRSVSKVHLEFGQDAGNFWIMDRFSGNGTIIREPDSLAVRCEPGKRYRLSRGTRVEIGEQFFIVS